MLEPQLIDAIKSYSSHIKTPVTLVVGTGTHPKRDELLEMLTEVANTTDKIRFDATNTDAALDGISFKIQNTHDTGIVFSGIPGGHEFSSFLLALLQAGGHTIKLGEDIISLVQGIKAPLNFEVYVSLSCHNCPDVVQTLNSFALLNDVITTRMIDGGVYPDEVSALGLQGVPAVYLNGKPFANGKIDTAVILEKLASQIEMTPVSAQMDDQDVTVLGGGPAGVAAAIYIARKGLKVALITDRVGGQVKDTQDIENLISVPLTTGPTLSADFAKHLAQYPITLKEHVRVNAVEKADTAYKVTLNTGITFTTKTLIVATGAKWRKLGLEGEDELIGKGVAYCPHCDGPFFKGKPVAVIGGGNSGIEAALDLAGIVSHVTVLEFADTWRADQVLIDKAKQKDNITLIASAHTQNIHTQAGKVSGLGYVDRNTGTSNHLTLDAIFVQIGLVPSSEVVQGLVETTDRGEIVIDERCATSTPGIFACGDVTTVPFKQINIAMGEGSKAALSAFEYLTLHG